MHSCICVSLHTHLCMIQDVESGDIIVHSGNVVFHTEYVCRIFSRQGLALHESLDQLFEDLKSQLSLLSGSLLESTHSEECFASLQP